MKRRVVAMLATVAIGGSGLAGLSATYAEAVGGNCTSAKDHRTVDFAPDDYRVRASCTSLQGDSKARGRLDRTGGVDSYTVYFTTLRTSYYGPWGNCQAGCTDRVEIAHV